MVNYTDAEVSKILNIYRDIIPELSPQLLEYWDLNDVKKRDWSCLTTNFHQVEVEKIKKFNRVAQDLISNGKLKLNSKKLGVKLRDVSRKCGVGYSLGISPWTDCLISEHINSRSKKLIIILGHDWYPIVTGTGRLEDSIRPPLSKFSFWPKYKNTIPESIKNGDYLLFFLNLYPDFRPPLAIKTGRIKGADYDKCTKGFEAVCAAITRKSAYSISGIISWGAFSWESLRTKTDVALSKMSLINAIKYQHSTNNGQPITLNLGGIQYSYFPFPHPSDLRNYKCFHDIYKCNIPHSLKLG